MIHWLKFWPAIKEGFRYSYKEVAIAGHDGQHTTEQINFDFLFKIDRYISTKNDVEGNGKTKRLQQIHLLKSNHAMDGIHDFVSILVWSAVLFDVVRWHSPLDFQFGIHATFTTCDCLLGDIGCNNLNVPLMQIRDHLMEHNRDRTRFLTRTCCCRPYSQASILFS